MTNKYSILITWVWFIYSSFHWPYSGIRIQRIIRNIRSIILPEKNGIFSKHSNWVHPESGVLTCCRLFSKETFKRDSWLRRYPEKRGREVTLLHTANSRKVVGKSARDNPERYCGWFWIHCSSKKIERMTREAMDVCLRVLKESNKSRFDSYSVRNRVLIISHITFRDCRVHIFSDNLSRNSCIQKPRRESCFPEFVSRHNLSGLNA